MSISKRKKHFLKEKKMKGLLVILIMRVCMVRLGVQKELLLGRSFIADAESPVAHYRSITIYSSFIPWHINATPSKSQLLGFESKIK